MGKVSFKFDAKQEFQLKAIDAVVSVFEGQPLGGGVAGARLSYTLGPTGLNYCDGLVGNSVIEGLPFLKNVQRVQCQNGINESERLESCEYEKGKVDLNFTIEMETGTGKTYTYLRTIFELNKRYGFAKFVIVVPSVPIREGVMQSLEDTREHFRELYDNVPFDFMLYDSGKKGQLNSYARAGGMQILVINIDSFKKDSNIINKASESGHCLIEFIRRCCPIVIVDEPQNMESDISREAIGGLNPLCVLRYSATHKNYYNLLYSLNPVEAYDLGLVKQIEVDGITVERGDYNGAYVSLKDIVRSGKTKTKVKVGINIDGGKSKIVTAGIGDDLFELSGRREIYRDEFKIEEINIADGFVKFANGLILTKGETSGGLTDEVMKFQIERTLRNHFEKEERCSRLGIKVLSLFFIDKVANYRGSMYGDDKGKFAIWFEELFEELKPEGYPYSVKEVHNGYFSQDKDGRFKDTKEGIEGAAKYEADNDAYRLIMKDKKDLLDENVPLRFIFSHSALREGWDNPNVFQICTLNETQSVIKKRQEIGRGMRLPVDNKGDRITDKSINILTIIANESYAAFSESLQREIEDETSVVFSGRIKNKRDRIRIVLTKELNRENCPDFFEIWDKISCKTRYKVEYKTEDLVKRAIAGIEAMAATKQPLVMYNKAKITISNEGVCSIGETQGVYGRLGHRDYKLPDILGYIQGRVNISKSTIAKILCESGRLEEVRVNPQMFLDNVVMVINDVLQNLQVEGIKYECIYGQHYEMSLFENEDIEMYLDKLVKVDENKKEKTLYDYIPIDGITADCPERKFADDCQRNDSVKFFFKLPEKFKINTPMGNYNPDWAIVLEEDRKVYFITDTKSTLEENKLRVRENMSIKCGVKWSKSLDKVEFRKCTELQDLL